MQVFVELFLFRVEEAELAARLAEAIELRPEQARDALFLLKGDPRVEPLSAPTLLTRDDRTASMEINLKSPASEVLERLCTWEVIPRVEVSELEVSLDMKQILGAGVDWSARIAMDDAFTAVVLEPDLLVVVSPALLPDEEAAAAHLQARKEQKQRLEPMLGRERAVRRAVNALLEG